MRFLLRNAFNLNTEVDQLHVVSIFTKLPSKDLSVGELNKVLQSELSHRKRLTWVILNLGMFLKLYGTGLPQNLNSKAFYIR